MKELKDQNKIVEVKNLIVQTRKEKFSLLGPISLNLYQNEVLAIIGESGSGKTTLAQALMGILSKNVLSSGKILFLPSTTLWARGKDKAMIFQDPQVSLHPFFKIEFQLEEVLKAHLKLKKKERRRFLISRLLEVGIECPHEILKAYPHHLSGGEKQRILIAMALLCDPKLLIADEPTASLDLILRVQILKLLSTLKKKQHFSLLLITHDISSALKIADRILVLKEGKVIEERVKMQCHFKNVHPYTQLLLKSRILDKNLGALDRS